MKITVYGTNRTYLHEIFEKLFAESSIDAELNAVEDRLTDANRELAFGSEIICLFVNDTCSVTSVEEFHRHGTRLIVTQSAGFDHIPLDTCKSLGIPVLRVPAYSPYAVAEFAVTLLLSLNRKIVPHIYRTRAADFSLNNLVGFDVRNATIGVCGTGLIGRIFVQCMSGFGCKILAYDPFPFKPWAENPETSPVEYVDLDTLLTNSDVVSIHTPLLESTRHMINRETISKMKDGAILLNVSRGALIDTDALIEALESGKLGGAGLDVVEGENEVFWEQRECISCNRINKLLNMDNVILSGHCAFLTNEALTNIATTTIHNIKEYISGHQEYTNRVV